MLPKVLDGSTPQQIEAIWQFLSDGRSATEPYGLGRDPMPLVPEKDAILYRNFLNHAGPRGIAVGYPEHASLSFDADSLRLAQIWQGAFIDAARHWTGRGTGFGSPLGDNVLNLSEGPDLAFLDKPEDSWPLGSPRERGDAFRGYRLSKDGRPTFLYEIGSGNEAGRGGVHVTDYPDAIPGALGKPATIRRALTVSTQANVAPLPRSLWFRALAASKIEPLGDGWYAVDGEWKLRISAEPAAEPVLRSSKGRTELLVPVRLDHVREMKITQEFVW